MLEWMARAGRDGGQDIYRERQAPMRSRPSGPAGAAIGAQGAWPTDQETGTKPVRPRVRPGFPNTDHILSTPALEPVDLLDVRPFPHNGFRAKRERRNPRGRGLVRTVDRDHEPDGGRRR